MSDAPPRSVELTLPEEVVAALEKFARERGHTMAQVLQDAVTDAVAVRPLPPDPQRHLVYDDDIPRCGAKYAGSPMGLLAIRRHFSRQEASTRHENICQACVEALPWLVPASVGEAGEALEKAVVGVIVHWKHSTHAISTPLSGALLELMARHADYREAAHIPQLQP